MKVLITGARGQVGQALLASVPPGVQATGVSRAQLDIGNAEAVRAMVGAQAPDVIINAAAYTAVDKAESEPEAAQRGNAEGPRHLAAAARVSGARLIHISTDFVFDGQASRPYAPDAPTHPLGVYGRTKRAGEEAVLAAVPGPRQAPDLPRGEAARGAEPAGAMLEAVPASAPAGFREPPWRTPAEAESAASAASAAAVPGVQGAGAAASAQRQPAWAEIPVTPAAVVVRTAWVYAAQGANFLRTMLRVMAATGRVRVVADQVGTPTAASSLAQALWAITARPQVSGIHHWTDAGVASWYDFAVAIAEEAAAIGLLPAGVVVEPITTEQYPTPARRPAYSVLDKRSTCQVLQLQPPHWRVNLRAVLRSIPRG